MDEMIKSMVEAIEKYEAGYIKVGFGNYSVIVADKETTEFIEKALDEENQTET